MPVDEASVVAAGEAAAAVARRQRPAKRGRDRPPLAAERQQLAAALLELDERAVAGEPPRRLRRERPAVGELAAPVRVLGERLRVDVDHHLVALTARAVAIGAGECEVRDRHQRLRVRGAGRPVCSGRRRRRPGFGRIAAPALPERISACVERPQDQGAVLGRESRTHRQRAVVRPGAAQELTLLLLRRLLPGELPVGAHGTFELRCSRHLRKLQQPLLALRLRDSRQDPHLRVRELAARECAVGSWQLRQALADPLVLACLPGQERASPGEPRCERRPACQR